MPIIEKYPFSKNNNFATWYIVHLLWIRILKAKYYRIMQKKKKNEDKRIIIRNTFMPIIEKYPFSKKQ